MPRFTGQNKKRKDPRYFLHEDINEEEPPWGDGGQPASGTDPMARASELAQKGMRSKQPPWGDGGQPASGGDPMARAGELAQKGIRSATPDDESVEDEADDLEAIASSLRTYEKDLTRRKGSVFV